MRETPVLPMSASMALAALTDACNDVTRAAQAERDARRVRDNLIRDARAAKIPYTTIMKRTGLSRDRLIKICHEPDERDLDESLEKPRP